MTEDHAEKQTTGTGAGDSAIDTIRIRAIESQVVQVLRTLYDPEIPVNIYDLGLIYDIDVDRTGSVIVRMTLTSPACPVAGTLPPEVEARVRGIQGVKDATVQIVWDPPWTLERMSEAARLDLGIV